MANFKICKVPSCSKPTLAKDLCGAHYHRLSRHGDPLGGRTAIGEPLKYLTQVVLGFEGTECLTWPYARGSNGYGHLFIDGRDTIVSRFVCEKHHGPPPSPRHEAAHSCGKGHEGCCNKGHLDWKLHVDNVADTLTHGTRNRGERCGSAKLTEEQVRAIRRDKGVITQRDLAATYGVTRESIKDIHNGRNWAWLE